jgi:hypothetical protein
MKTLCEPDLPTLVHILHSTEDQGMELPNAGKSDTEIRAAVKSGAMFVHGFGSIGTWVQ